MLFNPNPKPPARTDSVEQFRPRRHTPPKRPVSDPRPNRAPVTRNLKGKCYVIDGDTIVISGTKIRIAGIDAPELEHPWGKKSKFTLVSLCKGKVVTAVIKE